MSDTPSAPTKIASAECPARSGTNYPEEFRAIVAGRSKRVLGNLFNLDQFGVNLTELQPGAASAMRHWHEREDEFIYILSGRPVLITDEGETQLEPGDCAGFKAGVANGHQLVNREATPALYLEVGSRLSGEICHYPDTRLRGVKGESGWRFEPE